MRFKNFGVVAALFLLVGILFIVSVMGDDREQINDPILPPHELTGAGNFQDVVPGGRVVTNDERPGSAPFQSTERQSDDIPPPAVPRPKQRRKERVIVINDKEYPLRTYKTLLSPNDPFAAQWWVSNSKLDQAWDTPAGNNETLLAIIDTGFGLNHEEFAGRWHTNPGESGPAGSEGASSLNCTGRGLALDAGCNLVDDNVDGIVDNESGPVGYENPSRLNCSAQSKPLTRDCNRIDDDGNGYIDDTRGWDFVNFDNSTQAGELNPNGTGTDHGTLVAGVAAATGNNGKGIAGANWDTKILPIQAIDDDSYGDTYTVGRAILYAAEQGADVISLSLGSDLPDDYVQEAVQFAIASGSVVVAASGNDGCECMVYPANYAEVVAVGALNSSGVTASFSSWGQNLDLLAPGTSITSPTWQPANQTAAYASGVNGTSFAAPIVSGMMARLLSQQPATTPLQLIASITENTNRMSLAATTAHDTKLGYGSLDSAKSTSRMIMPRNFTQLYAITPVYSGNAPLFTASETTGKYVPYQCESGTFGSTRVYELIKNTTRLFSVSAAEADKARKNGYSATTLAHTCLLQPHDTATHIRNIDIFQEFRHINTYRPL